jgi:hypothetical protein
MERNRCPPLPIGSGKRSRLLGIPSIRCSQDNVLNRCLKLIRIRRSDAPGRRSVANGDKKFSEDLAVCKDCYRLWIQADGAEDTVLRITKCTVCIYFPKSFLRGVLAAKGLRHIAFEKIRFIEALPRHGGLHAPTGRGLLVAKVTPGICMQVGSTRQDRMSLRLKTHIEAYRKRHTWIRRMPAERMTAGRFSTEPTNCSLSALTCTSKNPFQPSMCVVKR